MCVCVCARAKRVFTLAQGRIAVFAPAAREPSIAKEGFAVRVRVFAFGCLTRLLELAFACFVNTKCGAGTHCFAWYHILILTLLEDVSSARG